MNLTRFKISSLLSGQLQASSLQPYEIMGHYVHFLLWCWGVPVSGTKPKWSLNNVGHVHRRLCSLSSCLSYLCSVWLSNWQTPSFQLHHIHCTTYTALYTLHHIHSTIYTAPHTQHYIHCTTYTALYTLHHIHSTIYTAPGLFSLGFGQMFGFAIFHAF